MSSLFFSHAASIATLHRESWQSVGNDITVVAGKMSCLFSVRKLICVGFVLLNGYKISKQKYNF